MTAQAGDVIPVGQTIALIFGADEAAAVQAAPPAAPVGARPAPASAVVAPVAAAAAPKVSPLARKVAEQHGVDIAQVAPSGRRIEKADVLAFVERRGAGQPGNGPAPRLAPASPKARRLAAERGLDVSALRGSGPGRRRPDGRRPRRRGAAPRLPRPPLPGSPRRRPPALRVWAPSGGSWSSA